MSRLTKPREKLLQNYVGFKSTGAEIRGASAFDIALWDILGQFTEVPLYQLHRQDIQLFMQGKVGITHEGTWSTAQLENQKDEAFKYWFVVHPQGPQGNGKAGTTWSNMFVLPKGTPNPDASWDLDAPTRDDAPA